ncbi:MAG: TAXI family TRAP transporter solute-binding subunit [Rhodospirillaceae bacterium]
MATVPLRPLPRLLLSLVWALLGCAWTGAAASAADGDLRYFRIGTGTSAGAYFIVGGLLANAITNPPGSRPCERGGSCGVPGLIGVAQATSGGVENLELLRAGALEAALVQANLAAWAYRGAGLYQGQPPFADLRALATLYTETVQIVVRADGPIRRVADLKGRKVSVGEKGSAFAIDAAMILGGLGLGEKRFTPVYLRPGASVDQLVAGQIDALFILGGAPFSAVSDAAARLPVRLLAFTPDEARELRSRQPFLTDAVIAAEVYPGVPETATVGVGAQLVVRAGLDAELVAGVTRALWQPTTRRALEQVVAKGGLTPLPLAVDAAALPLHPGAGRAYESLNAEYP